MPLSDDLRLRDCRVHVPFVIGGCVASLISRPEQEFREMFFDIWAARPGTKLLKIWAQMGLDQRSDPQFRAVERVRRPLKTDHSDRRRRERGEIAPEDQNTVFPT